jgi:hypothetical protein
MSTQQRRRGRRYGGGSRPPTVAAFCRIPLSRDSLKTLRHCGRAFHGQSRSESHERQPCAVPHIAPMCPSIGGGRVAATATPTRAKHGSALWTSHSVLGLQDPGDRAYICVQCGSRANSNEPIEPEAGTSGPNSRHPECRLQTSTLEAKCRAEGSGQDQQVGGR